jgi:hypothetical protein
MPETSVILAIEKWTRKSFTFHDKTFSYIYLCLNLEHTSHINKEEKILQVRHRLMYCSVKGMILVTK